MALGILLQIIHVDPLRLGVHQPKLIHSRPGIDTALRIQVQVGRFWREDFDDEIGGALGASFGQNIIVTGDKEQVRLKDVDPIQVDVERRVVELPDGMLLQVVANDQKQVAGNALVIAIGRGGQSLAASDTPRSSREPCPHLSCCQVRLPLAPRQPRHLSQSGPSRHGEMDRTGEPEHLRLPGELNVGR